MSQPFRESSRRPIVIVAFAALAALALLVAGTVVGYRVGSGRTAPREPVALSLQASARCAEQSTVEIELRWDSDGPVAIGTSWDPRELWWVTRRSIGTPSIATPMGKAAQRWSLDQSIAKDSELRPPQVRESITRGNLSKVPLGIVIESVLGDETMLAYQFSSQDPGRKVVSVALFDQAGSVSEQVMAADC